jgi:uncharacterized protein DUF6624
MDEVLRRELERMRESDQAMRLEAMAIAKEHGRSSPEYAAIRDRGIAMDGAHLARLVQIVETSGWPGTSLVGELASGGAFLVLQHGDLDTQKRFLPLVRDAAAAGEAARRDLALLEDRVRMMSGQRQLYGTQIVRNAEGRPEPWPIEDEANVDARRLEAGLEPLADYVRRFASTPGPGGPR